MNVVLFSLCKAKKNLIICLHSSYLFLFGEIIIKNKKDIKIIASNFYIIRIYSAFMNYLL